MMHSNLEVAVRHLQAAYEVLIAELQTAPDTDEMIDAVNLTADAVTQVRGEIRNREYEQPRRYDWLGGAA
jgi:hypothetical protein